MMGTTNLARCATSRRRNFSSAYLKSISNINSRHLRRYYSIPERNEKANAKNKGHSFENPMVLKTFHTTL
jgi:hypothetical protein